MKGGLPTFAASFSDDKVAPIPAVRRTGSKSTESGSAVIRAALIVLVDNNMVGRRIHGMIAPGGWSEEVPSEPNA